MIPTARDLMETHVIAVSPESSLLDVHRLFVEEEISGAPVIDGAGNLLGVITKSDLLRAVDEERDSAVVETDYFRELLPYSAPDWGASSEDFQNRLAERQVEEVMTPGLIAVSPDASAAEVARALRENRVHRVFVMEDKRLLGVVSAFDVLKVLEDWRG
jgi:CBS domain-containing protein